MIAFDIQGGVNGETAEELFLIFNANETASTVALPEGNWNVYINGEQAGTQALSTVKDGSAEVAPISAMVLVKEDAPVASNAGAEEQDGVNPAGLTAGVAILVVATGGAIAAAAVNNKKKKKS